MRKISRITDLAKNELGYCNGVFTKIEFLETNKDENVFFDKLIYTLECESSNPKKPLKIKFSTVCNFCEYKNVTEKIKGKEVKRYNSLTTLFLALNLTDLDAIKNGYELDLKDFKKLFIGKKVSFKTEKKGIKNFDSPILETFKFLD